MPEKPKQATDVGVEGIEKGGAEARFSELKKKQESIMERYSKANEKMGTEDRLTVQLEAEEDPTFEKTDQRYISFAAENGFFVGESMKIEGEQSVSILGMGMQENKEKMQFFLKQLQKDAAKEEAKLLEELDMTPYTEMDEEQAQRVLDIVEKALEFNEKLLLRFEAKAQEIKQEEREKVEAMIKQVDTSNAEESLKGLV